MKFVGTALVLLGSSILASCRASSPGLPPTSPYGADARVQTPFQPHSAFAPRARQKTNGPIIIMANPNGSWQLYSINSDGKALHQITHLPATSFTLWFPELSPDGTRIVFNYYPNNSGPLDVYTINVGGGGLKRIVHNGVLGSPNWSPDGKRLIYSTFSATTGRKSYLVTTPVDQPERQTVVTSDLYEHFWGEYMPDGQSIMYVTSQGGVDETWIMNADGSDKRPLTAAAPAFCPYSISADGKRVLLNDHCPDGQLPPTIWVMNIDDQKVTQLTHSQAGSADLYPAYSPDGKKIAFASNLGDPNNLDLWVMNADGTDKHVIKTGLTIGGCPGNPVIFQYCVTPIWAPAQQSR